MSFSLSTVKHPQPDTASPAKGKPVRRLSLLSAGMLSGSLMLAAAGIGSTAVLGVLPTTAHAATAIDFSDLVTQVTPGVARVNVTKRLSEAELAEAQTAELLRQFFGSRVRLPERAPVEYAYGTAFFVSDDGYLLTNHHVIAGADSISITLNDRTELDATLVGSDESSDVAVLKVSGSALPALPIGDSNALRVGEPVLAIGSPFGFDYSASAGIVSAKSRNFSRETSVPFIQSDVALNPGNSGGPLFNRRGEVVGINSRIFSGTGGYMGLSFSIPIDAAMDIFSQIKDTGGVARAYLGVQVQDVDRNLAEAYRLERPQGALLTRVSPDSPASRAGLRSGDLVLEYNRQGISMAAELLNHINRARPGDAFAMLVQRQGERLTLTGQFASVPSDMQAEVRNTQNSGLRLGLRLRNLSAAEQESLQVSSGVLITAVDPMGLAARSGLQSGDVVLNLHQKPTASVAQFSEALSSLPAQGVVTIEIMRQGSPAIIGLRLE